VRIRTVAAVIPFLVVPPAAGAASDYSSPYGEWRGQAQFHARIGAEDDPKAHAVTELAIAIDPQGKLVGSSASNGCRALGLATPSGPKTVVNLDVTLSGCAYAGFNRRFSGNLFLYPKDSYASLRLRSLITNNGTKPVSYDIRATLKR
jgi:hypothetical protein